jgi:pilus assembly protein Flp/PilA
MNSFTALRDLVRDEDGANGVEYAMLAGLIAVTFAAGAGVLGTAINDFFTLIAGCMGQLGCGQ